MNLKLFSLFLFIFLSFFTSCNQESPEYIAMFETDSDDCDSDLLLNEENFPDVDKNLNFCHSNTCKNYGKCINLEDTYKCECKPGFSGKNCEQYDPLIFKIQLSKSRFKNSTSATVYINRFSTLTIDCYNNNHFEIKDKCVFYRSGEYTIKLVTNYLSLEDLPSELIEITHWGNVKWKSMHDRILKSCQIPKISAKDAPKFFENTNLQYTFAYCENFNTDISNWDISKVNNLKGMFKNASKFNQPLNKWNIANIKDMSEMFEGATNFNQPLNNWDVSNVTDMNSMFKSASSFNQPLNNWDVTNVKNMSEMFESAINFNQSLNNWDVSNVTNMNSMFEGAINFNQPLNNWDVSNVTDMNSMFKSATKFNQPLNNWNISNVFDMSSMFYGAEKFNQPLNKWNVSNVLYMSQMFDTATAFNQPLENWDVSNVQQMFKMFHYATKFNQPLNKWNTSKLKYMSKMFCGAQAFNQPLDKWNISNAVAMFGMFEDITLSTDYYDAMLISWSKQSVKSNISFSAGKSNYCAGKNARTILTNKYSWKISDGGENCGKK